MADYQLTATGAHVIRTIDHAIIPNDPSNNDWIEYQAWLAEGGVPDPYVPPEPVPPQADPQTSALYDHENRIRMLEGQPQITLMDFFAKMKA